RGIRAALVEHKLDFRIDEVATVSICQFGTFGMWKDLDDHWDVLEQSPIVRHLTYNPGESFRDPHTSDDTLLEHIAVVETDVPVPIPADGSQLRAVALAAEGRTFVLEGPPGTGKSQTITNLIAHSLSKGKTVLFVAEKQAALDVVKKRLAKIGLSDFTLDLHGKSQRPNEIREQLRNAIDNSVRYNELGWTAKLARFRSCSAPLEDYPGKIHSRNGADESLWRAYESVLTIKSGVAAPIPSTYVAKPSIPHGEITDALEHFSRAARSV
ncbi:AAA family ATPase, partial [Streptomyces sp. SID10244]|nr:AAA family ATPase [Streptomyces sp. SID10244]